MKNLHTLAVAGLIVLLAQAQHLHAQNVLLRGNELSLRDGTTGNTVTLTVPNASVASSFTLTLPASAPTGNDNILIANTSGSMSWIPPGGSNTVLTSNGSTLSWSDPSAALGAWLTSGNSTTSAWNGSAGQFLGTTSNQPLVLATRSAPAQPILFFTGSNGALERMRINALGGVQIGTSTGPAQTQLAIGGIAATGGRGIDINMSGTTTSSGLTIRNVGANGSDHAGLLIGTTSDGVGTAMRIGTVTGFNDPSVGIEIEATTVGLSAMPTTSGSGTGLRVGTTGTRFRTGLETYVRATAGNTAIGVNASASAATGGLGIGVHATTSGITGNLFPLVVSSANNADVYLGSSTADQPSALTTLLTGTQNANTTRMHNARLSGSLTLRGTGTGTTSILAGAQGTTNINYTLPTSAPTATNMVLISTPAGAMSWANPSSLSGILEEATTGQGNIRRRTAYLQFLTQGVPGQWSIDLQGARNQTTQTASGDYSGILAGRFNTAAGDYGAIVAGENNAITLNSDFSVIVAGTNNTLTQSSYSMIGAGENNELVSSNYSAIVAGTGNEIVNSPYAMIGAGENNVVEESSTNSAIAAGENNTVTESVNSFIGAGAANEVTLSATASIASGGLNTVSESAASFIGSGLNNSITNGSFFSTIVGGTGNLIEGSQGSVIVGGAGNSIEGDASSILGGNSLTLRGNSSVGFNTGGQMTVDQDNVAVFANANIWLANNSGTPSELRFYSAQAAPGDFPAPGTYYVGLRAPASGVSSDVVYTLPASPPIADGSFLTSTTSGTLSWTTPSESAFWSTSGNNISSGWNGVSGSFIGTSSASTAHLSIATRNLSPADIRFYTGVSGSSERVRIDGSTGNVGINVSSSPTRKLDVNGTVRIGANGTTITNVIKESVTHDITTVSATTSHSFDLTVPNAATSASVIVSPSADLPDGLAIVNARVSALGTVTVTVFNTTAADINPDSMEYHVVVIE